MRRSKQSRKRCVPCAQPHVAGVARAASRLDAALHVEGLDGSDARGVGHHGRLREVGALAVVDPLVGVGARLELGDADARAVELAHRVLVRAVVARVRAYSIAVGPSYRLYHIERANTHSHDLDLNTSVACRCPLRHYGPHASHSSPPGASGSILGRVRCANGVSRARGKERGRVNQE